MKAACINKLILIIGIINSISLWGATDIPLPSIQPPIKAIPTESNRSMPMMPSRLGEKPINRVGIKTTMIGKMSGDMPKIYVRQLMEFVKNEMEIIIPSNVRKAAQGDVEKFKDLLIESENAEWFKKISSKIAFIVAEAEQERRILITRIKRGREQREMRNDIKGLKKEIKAVHENQQKLVAKLDKIIAILDEK